MISLHKWLSQLVDSFTFYGGGGGGGDGGAADRAAAEKARVAAGISRLNTVFGTDDPNSDAYKSREQLYSKIGTDATNVGLTDINKERGISQRELGFILARNGLSGGSRDIDANKDVLDTYNQGVLKASNIGSQTANNARSADEKTRVGLINSIQAGLSDSDAMTQAYTGMANNARQAQDAASLTSLAGFFDVLRQQQANAQYQQGVNSVTNPVSTAQKSAKSSYGGSVKNYA